MQARTIDTFQHTLHVQVCGLAGRGGAGRAATQRASGLVAWQVDEGWGEMLTVVILPAFLKHVRGFVEAGIFTRP